jgi:hypothetical protein
LWNFSIVSCSWLTKMFSSLRGSPSSAVSWVLRGRSSSSSWWPISSFWPPEALSYRNGVVHRSPTVDAVQVEPGAAEVGQRVRVVLPFQAGGGVEGDVVVDELAQVGVAGRDRRVVQLRGRAADLLQHQRRDLGDPLVAGNERRQPKHPPEAALVQAGDWHVRQAAQLVAVAAGRSAPIPDVVGRGRPGELLLSGSWRLDLWRGRAFLLVDRHASPLVDRRRVS